MIFCYHSISLLFRNADPCTWTECGKIHHSVLIKCGDNWARSNFQLWYTGRSYAIIASALTRKLHFVKKKKFFVWCRNFFCYLHLYDNIFLFRFLWEIPKSFFIPQIVKRTKVVVPRIMNNWKLSKKLAHILDFTRMSNWHFPSFLKLWRKNLNHQIKVHILRFILSGTPMKTENLIPQR